MNRKIAVGFSGGVDSLAAALILREQGFEVLTVTLDLTGTIIGCAANALKTTHEAKRTAKLLGFENVVITNFREKFREDVVNYFVAEYIRGRTPNPCVMCNPKVKFRALFSAADKYGCDLVATGHYARSSFDKQYNTYVISRAKSEARDQSYMLYRLPEEMRKRLIFPLGGLEKDAVRAFVREYSLDSSNKPDSQENCFIPDGDHASFIEKYTGVPPLEGNFLDMDNKILGRHQGIVRYTVGQRKGLGISFGEPKFVTRLDAQNNAVVLGSNEDLFSTNVEIDDIKTIINIDAPMRAYAKIRSAAKPQACYVSADGAGLKLTFDEPVRAATAGQSAVFYDERGVLIGGGIIK